MKHLLTVISLFCHLFLLSQKEYSQWYFGNKAGLNFLTNPPSPLTNNAMSTMEGTACMSDSLGNILFYSNGVSVWNKNHTLMANGNGLTGHASTTQSALIVKKPGSSHLYYLFTLGEASQPNGTLAYSIVDMSLAAGLGSVTVKNDTLAMQMTEKLCGSLHCNGTDVWVLAHKRDNSDFYAYLVSAAGVSTVPVTSSQGPVHGPTPLFYTGQMKISPHGKKLSVVTAPTSLGNISLYDFNSSTGQVSNGLSLGTFNVPYGTEFSPDGSKLYAHENFSGAQPYGQLYQWDLCSASVAASQVTLATAPTSTVFGPLQVASDGKIYVQHSLSSSGISSVGTISNPNASGVSSNFSFSTTSIGAFSGDKSLPNFISTYFRQKASYSNTSSCGLASFSYTPPLYCPGVTYSVNSVQWNFGDPASAGSNTSTLPNPTHSYTANGTYTTQLIVTYDCFSDVITNTITINDFPVVTVVGNQSVCINDKIQLSASGADTYSWSTGSTSPTITATASTSLVYTVTGTYSATGCSSSKIVSVSVNPCTGLSQYHHELDFRLYPNPVNHLLNVHISASAKFEIVNQLGEIIETRLLSPGTSDINVHDLPKGLYFVRLVWENEVKVSRMIKE